jgi:hypothetical protein
VVLVNGTVVSDLSDDSSDLEDRPTVLSIQGCAIEVFNALAPTDLVTTKYLE